jgi:DNA-directed RNA polymerase specialized sigma24 family protein
MNESKEDEILQELQRITKLLVLIATKDQSQRDKIAALSSVGFQPKEMADLLGTTANTVRVTLSDIRKKARGEKDKAEGLFVEGKSNDEQATS